MLCVLVLAAAAARAADFAPPKLPSLPVVPELSAAAPVLPGLPALPGPLSFSLDRTDELRAIQRQVRAQAAPALPPQAGQVRYLLVPGHSWRALPGYFAPALERLASLGLDAKRVDTDAFGRVADNAARVRSAIAASDKPVVLVGHSRGGLEALEALRQDPTLGAKVRAVIAVQTPWAGTPAALLAPRRLLPASRELGEKERSAQAAAPPTLPEGVALRSVATSLGRRTRAKALAGAAARLLRLWTGEDADGVVPTEAALIPGSVYARLEHVGHWDTVASAMVLKLMGLGARHHDPRFAADFAEALVRWLFAGPRPNVSAPR